MLISVFIVKKKGQKVKVHGKMQSPLHVRGFATNGKILFSTETFTQKPSAWYNIRAIMKSLGGKSILVQDNSLVEGPVVFKLGLKGAAKRTTIKPRKLKANK